MEEDYSVRFKNALIENGITNIKDYYYCGGREKTITTRHKNYFKLVFGDKEPLNHKNKCICGHNISQNCYASKKTNNKFDYETIIVLGNCCIKKFEINGRTCENCNAKHKNRKNNYCNDCKERCIYCGNSKNKKKSEAICDNCRYKCEKCEKRLKYDGLCNTCYYESKFKYVNVIE